MASDRRVIVVKEGGGALYTRPGENEETITNKAFCFINTWQYFCNAEDVTKLHRPSFVKDITAWNHVMKMYQDTSKVGWIKRMMDEGMDLMSCNEQAVREFLSKDIFDTRKINKKSTINNMCSSVRGMFRDIGREHAYGHGQIYKHLGSFLVDSANPLTTATERYLEQKLENIMKSHNETSKRQPGDKYGPPLSIITAYTIMLYHLVKLIKSVTKWQIKQCKQVERIVNLALLTLTYMFLMHEGSRPIELGSHLEHAHLFFPLHKRVYMLTLVFLSPSTLNYIMSNNLIPYYACGFYKGKDKQHKLYRLKSVIPSSFNAIDLPWIYTICMKIILLVSPTSLTKMVFKQNLNLTSLRHRILKNIAVFLGTTFYGFRYGAAEEDKKAKIDPNWTRQRMGHTSTSLMKDRYAKNEGKRIADSPLGLDAFDTPTNPKLINLEMNVIDEGGCAYDTQWLENSIPDLEMRKEFTEVSSLVSKFCEYQDHASYVELLERFKESHPTMDFLTELPLGTHFMIHPQLMSDNLKVIFDTTVSYLQQTFAYTSQPRIIPDLWSFPQVMYGNWRKLLDIPDKYSTKDFIVPPKKTEPNKKPRLEEIITSTDDMEYDDDPTVSDIEPNDHVVILCKQPSDPSALQLPNIPNTFVWIVKARRAVSKKTGMLTGTFYKNKTKDITAPLLMATKPETVHVVDDCIVHIFAADPDNEFELTEDNILEIERHFET